MHPLPSPSPSETTPFRLASVSPPGVRPGSQPRARRCRPGHRRCRSPPQAGPRRRSAGHRAGTLGRASPSAAGLHPPPPARPGAGAGPRGSSAPNVGRGEHAPDAPLRLPVGGRAGRGEVVDAGALGRQPPPLGLQHVARSCARRQGPRAAPGPPPPVRRHPGGADPQPAARSLLQPGEAAARTPALCSLRGTGEGALGLFGPQFTQLARWDFALTAPRERAGRFPAAGSPPCVTRCDLGR